MTIALEDYGPTQPIPVLVAELNRLYHEHEAPRYERTHPEIFEQLPSIWRAMIATARDHLGVEPLRVLDIGCGTGFEAGQCLTAVEPGGVQRMVCYDPSPEMLRQCRQSLAALGDHVEFLTDLTELCRGEAFNVLLTNSVLHHMVDPVRAIRDVAPLLASNAIWLCGHEPSRRFLANPTCRAVLQRYRARDRWSRLLSPQRCARRLLRWVGAIERPEDYAARRAVELSMFERRPPAHLVSGLVDFHVVATESNLEEMKGLDFREFEKAFADEWELAWHRTYSFLGPYYADALPSRWRQSERQLAREFPDDGGNCCLVWRRRGEAI